MIGRQEFYRITGPISWAIKPEYFSYSSLTSIERCPLQWQLINSSYGEDLCGFPYRPAPSAVEGQIVHSVLDKLFKEFSLMGLPKIGTNEFRECATRVNIKKIVGLLVEEHKEKISKHPRGNGFNLRKTTQQLSNEVIRLFNSQYKQVAGLSPVDCRLPRIVSGDERQRNYSGNRLKTLDKFITITEVRLKSLNLSFVGAIDLVWQDIDQIIIVDFKTGQKDENYSKQVNYYAVLWEKVTGTIPSRIEVRYPYGVESFPISADRLKEVETEMRGRIEAASKLLSIFPASANRGAHCFYCDVRQFCDEYWMVNALNQAGTKSPKEAIDLELLIIGVPTDYGFEAETKNGQAVAVVYDSAVRKIHAPFNKNDCCRILRANHKREPFSIELKPWTEVFFRSGALSPKN